MTSSKPKKKVLKSVDIKDLRSSKRDIDIEDVDINGEVRIDDIPDDLSKSSIKNKSKVTVKRSKLVDKKISEKGVLKSKNEDIIRLAPDADPRLLRLGTEIRKEDMVKFMSKKETFDHKELNVWLVLALGLLMACAVFLPGYAAKNFKVAGEYGEYIRNIVVGMSSTYRVVSIIIAGALVMMFDLKSFTGKEFVIYYDGIMVPKTLFPHTRVMRVVLRWNQILRVDFETKRGFDYAIIKGERDRVLGHIRLDVDNYKDMLSSIDRLAPAGHPIRIILFNNSKQS